MREETFDLNGFVDQLTASPPDRWTSLISRELGRMRELVIRDPARRFQQQMYVTKLERLARSLRGEDVSNQWTPSEKQAYSLLQSIAPFPAAPVDPSPETLPKELTGKDRRTSRRIQMKTKTRIRCEAHDDSVIVEPSNVSRGGISFQAARRFALHEIVFVTMHYMPNSTEMETKSLIVRAAPVDGSSDYSYGVKFL